MFQTGRINVIFVTLLVGTETKRVRWLTDEYREAEFLSSWREGILLRIVLIYVYVT